MELDKLRDLIAMLRELGVKTYVDGKLSLELQYDEWVDVEDEEELAHPPSRTAAVDPELARLTASIPPDYHKAFKFTAGKK